MSAEQKGTKGTKVVKLMLKPLTSKVRAEEVRRAVEWAYPEATLHGARGRWEVRFKVRSGDIRPVWLILLLRDTASIKLIRTKR